MVQTRRKEQPMPNQMLIANLYNPHEQSKQELIDSFVVRLKIFHKLFSEIRNSDMKHPEQHFLIEAQRGMGKTTLLLRLSYEIENDAELNTWLIPIVFKEESYYGITRLFKLWEETARLLEAGEPEFAGLFNQMEAQYDENKDYERLCFEILTNALKQHHKKLILFIDNLSELFKNFNDMEWPSPAGNLMNCPEMRIIGATMPELLRRHFAANMRFTNFSKRAPLPGVGQRRDILAQRTCQNLSENRRDGQHHRTSARKNRSLSSSVSRGETLTINNINDYGADVAVKVAVK